MGKYKGAKIRKIETEERRITYSSLPSLDRLVRRYIEEKYCLTGEIPDREAVYSYLIMALGGEVNNSYVVSTSITKAIRSIKRSTHRERLESFLEELREAVEPIMEKYSDIPESKRYIWARTLLRALRNKK